MLATDHLLFIHLHKSGGTFINEFLMRYGSNARRIGYHLPYQEVPADLRHLPVLGTLRDPLGYYVSWYHFQSNMPRPNALFSITSDGGSLDFKKTITNLVSLEQDEQRLILLENAVPQDFVSYGLNLTKTCVRRLRGCGLGFYSYLATRMYFGVPDIFLIKTEQIRQDIANIMKRLDVPVDDRALSFLQNMPLLNTSRHGEILDYYDTDLLNKIHTSENIIYERLITLNN